MNVFKKLLTIGFFTVALCSTPLWANEPDEDAVEDGEITHFELNNPHSNIASDVFDFVSVPACYVGGMNLFVVIDSTENDVFMIYRADGFDTIRIHGDVAKGRHDLPAILRPKSVGYCDEHVLYLASSKKDSSYLAVLDLDGNEVHRVSFGSSNYSFKVFPDEIVVMGRNQLGFNVTILSLANGIEGISTDEGMCNSFSYKVPKQADQILHSDPYGLGLMVVAVSVVFLALLCISLILKAYGKSIMKIQDRKAKKNAVKNNVDVVTPSTAETSGDVFAAIATAIYLYDEELHDEEDTIITIQKVERAWTPWNAKFYNMNRYFINKR